MNSGVPQALTTPMPLFSVCLLPCVLTTRQLSLWRASHTSKSPSLWPLNSFNPSFPLFWGTQQILASLPIHLQDKNLNSFAIFSAQAPWKASFLLSLCNEQTIPACWHSRIITEDASWTPLSGHHHLCVSTQESHPCPSPSPHLCLFFQLWVPQLAAEPPCLCGHHFCSYFHNASLVMRWSSRSAFSPQWSWAMGPCSCVIGSRCSYSDLRETAFILTLNLEATTNHLH